MAAAAVPPSRPGLLLTHDWSHLHTPRAFLHTTSTEVDELHHSLTFPISNALQFHAFVNGLGRCEVDTDKNCPLQLVDGLDSGPPNACPQNPVRAIVKMNYKVTHTLDEAPTDRLVPDDVVSKLQEIDKLIIGEGNVRDHTTEFLKQYGSHFATGVQSLGKCFSWMVVVDEQCYVDLLQEIAEELFQLCDKNDSNFPGSRKGICYRPFNFLNCTGWSEEKQKLLQVANLCVICHDTNKATTTFAEWKQNAHDTRPVNVSPTSENIVSIWDLVAQSQMNYQTPQKLSRLLQDGWKRLVEESKHHSSSQVSARRKNKVPKSDPVEQPEMKYQATEQPSPMPQDGPWGDLLKDLEMQGYYPAKITMQQIRALREEKTGPTSQADIPWKILSQLMFLNSNCREEDISKLIVEKKGKKSLFKDRMRLGKGMSVDAKENIPHPMDVTLLVYLCADHMLRQVLAKKLFMCCLAIPFIVPTPDDRVQILMWPLRAIVMEGRTGKEAYENSLVTSNVNMVAFMRLGQTKKSKSKLMNTVLSNSSHDTFCHKDTSCGNRKRQISNGTVEMSHYLPSSAKSDHFSQPALFFNLRGDACAYPVQHQLLMELATVTVILLDLHELKTTPVQQLLQRTVSAHPKLVLILTNDKGYSDEGEELDELLKALSTLLGDHLHDVDIVHTFEDVQDRSSDEVIQEVREMIAGNMVQDPPHSLEVFAAKTSECPVDEDSHQPCKDGKSLANKISSQMNAISRNKRKQILLPRQGQVLHETGKLLKQLHRSKKKERDFNEKDDILKKLKAVKQSITESSEAKAFMQKVLALFQAPSEVRRFALKWLQLELDAISRTILPKLYSRKNREWDAMMKAKDAKTDFSSFEKEIASVEKQINAASVGVEHIMREMAHRYDIAADLGKLVTDGECEPSLLPAIAAQLLLDGQPLELMDGDHGLIPRNWVKAVFHSLARRVGKEKKLFVLSVMGIQSSGKSTLLNAVFGLEFAVSAGRCTKGIYAQLLPVAAESQLPFDYMLVLDSEGLRSQELGQNNYEHDNELATLVIGLSDLALINMKGENVMEITDILQIVVLAFLRMKQADSILKRKCMFIHQNVSAVNADEKLAVDRQKFLEQLNEMTRQASESQGLHQTVTSFNHVITFEGERDTVYFSDLWHGDPPMAPVNQGYSARAADTQQRILTDMALKKKSFRSIPEFVIRINDIWNGVLSDDFVFHFRNTLAAKAYLELERKFGQLTMELEEKVLQWVNTSCNDDMLNCHTEAEVESKCIELKSSLWMLVSQLQTEKLKELQDFFKNHASKEIVTQWEVEKKSSLQSCAKSLTQRMEEKLTNMKIRRSVDVQQQQMSYAKEQAILAQAIDLAEQLRGKCSEEALKTQFDMIWTPWTEEYIHATFHQPQSVKQMMNGVLEEMLTKDGTYTYLSLERDRARPYTHRDEFTSQDLTKDYTTKDTKAKDQANTNYDTLIIDDPTTNEYTTKTEHTKTKGDTKTKNQTETKPSKRGFLVDGLGRVVEGAGRVVGGAGRAFKGMFKRDVTKVEQANDMMKRVLDLIDNISQQDVMFEQHHGRRVIQFALQQVTEYNCKENIPFSFTPQFRAMFALRAVLYAVPAFERMDQSFDQIHGIHTKLNNLKKRIFKTFENAVQNASVEVSTADDFCQAIEGALYDRVMVLIDERVVKELKLQTLCKYDLIVQILDNIAETRNFERLNYYVRSPVRCARDRVRDVGNRLLFEESKFKQFADVYTDAVIKILKESTQAATRSAHAQGSDQYSEWVKLYSDMKGEFPLDKQQLRASDTAVIKDFKHFQKCLEDNLDTLEEALKSELSLTNADSVRWANDEDPFQRVFEHAWGCQEVCPFCSEPCKHTDPEHKDPHQCIQHRPSGVIGVTQKYTGLIWLTTCNMDVASRIEFPCPYAGFKCRETKHCNTTGDDEVLHPFREYKKFLPDWDIAPDSSGNGFQFWKWIMCTFQKDLVKRYRADGIKIPDFWAAIDKKEACDSLRIVELDDDTKPDAK